MKKRNFFSKTMITLIAVNMSLFLLAGCQSKSNNTAQAANSTTQNSKKPDPEQMKQKMQDNLKTLVTAGTITQAQSDKILGALTANTGKKDNQGTSSQSNTQNSNQNSQQSNSQQGNNQNKQRVNPLSKLVSDGTITQAQADAVMQKMRGNFNRKNNGQGSQNNTQTSTN